MELTHGTWVMDRSKHVNMDAFLNAAGFPAEMQEEYKAREYTCVYSGDAKSLNVKVQVTNRPNLPIREYAFTLGEELEIKGVDGETTLSTVTWDGTKFTERHRDPAGQYEFVMTREVKADKPDDMIFVSTMAGMGDVKFTEIYNRAK